MEDIDSTDGVYFVKSGEFEVNKKIKITKPANKDALLNQLGLVNEELKKSMKLNMSKLPG